jgi:hypothetical protein
MTLRPLCPSRVCEDLRLLSEKMIRSSPCTRMTVAQRARIIIVMAGEAGKYKEVGDLLCFFFN